MIKAFFKFWARVVVYSTLAVLSFVIISLESGGDRFRSFGETIQEASHSVAHSADSFRETVDQVSKTVDSARETYKSLEKTASELGETAEKLGKTISSQAETVRQAGAELGKLTESFNTTPANEPQKEKQHAASNQEPGENLQNTGG